MTFYDQDDPDRWPPSTPAGTMPQAPPGRRVDDQTASDLDTRPVDDGHGYDDPAGYDDPLGDEDPLGYDEPHEGDEDDEPHEDDERPAGRHGSRHDYVVLKGRRRNGHRVLVVLGIIAAVLAVLGVGAWWWYQRQIDPPGPPGEAIRVVIPSGTSTSGIGSLLDDEGVIANGTVWNLYTSRKHAGPFQAGTYTLRKNSDLDSVIDVMEAGPTRRTSSGAYLPAGLTVAELETQLSKSVERFTVPSIQRALSSGAVTSSLQPPGQESWEGLLYPGTYTISRHTAVADFLQKLSTKMEQAVAAESPEPATAAINEKWGLHLSTYDVLVAASLIQREAGNTAEMPKIATVIYNRLSKGVPLGIDATSVYEAKQNGTEIDFGSDSPYNTRTSKGLPPTPISTISDAALHAALHPADGPWKYYVLVAKGRHLFTDTYSDFAKGVEQCKAKHLGCG